LWPQINSESGDPLKEARVSLYLVDRYGSARMNEGLNNIYNNVPESSLEILKGRSLGRLVGPAFKHDVVQGRGTLMGKG